MTPTDEDYANALKTIHEYRKERGLDFYMVVNVEPSEEKISVEEFRRYLSITKTLET